jgi:hypothetical protein
MRADRDASHGRADRDASHGASDMVESDEDLKGEVERLRAENAALKERSSTNLRLQVSAKGGVSLYGVRRFPVTFYVEEWERILGMADEIRSFLRDNEGALKRKNS